MPGQLSLFDEPPPRDPKYSLFLALFPDPHTAQLIADLGNKLRERHGSNGRVRPVNHLHVSLLPIGHTDSVPAGLMQFMDQVCSAVAADTHPFEICLNRQLSFHGRPGNHPLVLVGDDHGNDGVKRLRGQLGAALTQSPLPVSRFTPHVTLLYDRQELAPAAVEPVFWTVKEICFVRSEVGATKYDRLGQWELGA
jgi:RNA 2',3'-cyclic 3'-phosphodiesterase